MHIELIANYDCQTGEGPLWHPMEKRVYWTDIPTGRLFRYDPHSGGGGHEQCYEGRPVGGFTIQADGALLLFRDKGNVVTWRDGRELDTVIQQIDDEVETRFNDVFADPRGRVFCGTMPTKQRPGRLYRLDPDGSLHTILHSVRLSNGMALTPDGKQLYYTETQAHTIWLFDYDRATGELSNQRPFVEIPDGNAQGHPDGMTCDAAGDVWSAMWDGRCVRRYAPTGELKEKLMIPGANQVSCVTFAGDGFDVMYITTAGGHDKQRNGKNAGALFRVDAGVRGQPDHLSRIGL